MSVEKYFIAGTSSNLNSIFPKQPPTCPPSGSSGLETNDPPVPSVYPYPSKNGQHTAIFKKSTTSLDMGADPDTINRILPPNAALVLLNTN